MDDFPLLILLPILTFALAVGFALWSRNRAKHMAETPTAKREKSSLAKDGPGPQPFR